MATINETRTTTQPPPPRPRGPVRRILSHWRWVVFPAIAVLAMYGAFWGAERLGERVQQALVEDTIPPGRPVTLVIPAGSSAGQIAEILEENGVVPSAADFTREVTALGVAAQLKAGPYEMVTGMSPVAVVAMVVEGPPAAEVFRLTVVEGLTVPQTLDRLAAATPFPAADYRRALLGGEVTSPLLPDEPVGLQAWEGLLFPDTYEFDDRDTPADILQRLADTMVARVGEIDWSYLSEIGLDRYDGIIVASLIEREAAVDEDRANIASVIYNRLDIDQLLQIDATVLYALGEQKSRITADDLEVDSPYNTYLYHGLPPTPIAAPGAASLRAASDPAMTDYFYYVLTDPSGQHSFAETFEEFIEYRDQAREDGVIP
jgi:UPF0755 protein